MKKYLFFTLLFSLFSVVILPSCSRKSGCPANESLKPKTNKKGEIIGNKKHKSGLFPKGMAKKMK